MVEKSSEGGVYRRFVFVSGWKAGLDQLRSTSPLIGLALCPICWPKCDKERKGRGRELTFIKILLCPKPRAWHLTCFTALDFTAVT